MKTLEQLQKEHRSIRARMATDRELLDALEAEMRPLQRDAASQKGIKMRSTYTIETIDKRVSQLDPKNPAHKEELDFLKRVRAKKVAQSGG